MEEKQSEFAKITSGTISKTPSAGSGETTEVSDESRTSAPSGKSGENVASQAGRMGAATLLSRFGGLFREQVFAYFFGATDVADAFQIAFRIPNLLRDLFAEGAMSAAFVPVFTRALTSGDVDGQGAKAWRLFFSVSILLGILLGVLSLLGVWLAPDLVRLYAGAYLSVPGKWALTVGLTQTMMPFFPLVALAAVCMGALNALGSFFLPAFAPALFNVVSIGAGVILCPSLEHWTSIPPIYGMAYGVVLGGFVQFYVQWRRLWKDHLKGFFQSEEQRRALWWRRPWHTDGVREILGLMIPGTVGLAATQLNILLNSVFATGQGSGAVSSLNYAFRLMQFPIGVFGVSLAAACLPQFTRAYGRGEAASLPGARATVEEALRWAFVVNVPAAAGLMALGFPLIELLFERGAFTYVASQQTYEALYWYAWGLVGYSQVKILVPCFYALGDTKVPVASSFLMVGLNGALNYFGLYVLHSGFWFLAFSTAVTATLNALALYFVLHRRLGGFRHRRILGAVGPMVVIGVVIFMGVSGIYAALDFLVAQFVGQWGALWAGWNFRPLLEWGWPLWIAKLSLGLIWGVFVWLTLGRWWELHEIEKTWQPIQRRLSRLLQ